MRIRRVARHDFSVETLAEELEAELDLPSTVTRCGRKNAQNLERNCDEDGAGPPRGLGNEAEICAVCFAHSSDEGVGRSVP